MFLSQNFLLKYTRDCTFSSRKWKSSLPLEGGFPPPHTLPSTVATLPRNLNSPIVCLSQNSLLKYTRDCTFSSRKMEKLSTVGGGTPPPTPPSVAALPYNLNSPIVFLSRNFLLKYAPDCTFSSRKMKKLPTVGGGIPPPTPYPHRSLLSLTI